jgi:hypothetical protein
MIGGVKSSEMNLLSGRFISHGVVYQALGAISSARADRRCGLSAPPIMYYTGTMIFDIFVAIILDIKCCLKIK